MQAIELIRDYYDKLENWRIVWAFKKLKMKFIREATVELMKVCLALNAYGLPITTRLASSILEKGVATIGMSLHILGDKKCLILKRGLTGSYGSNEWVVSPLFMDNYPVE